jgi:hypothetical protein
VVRWKRSKLAINNVKSVPSAGGGADGRVADRYSLELRISNDEDGMAALFYNSSKGSGDLVNIVRETQHHPLVPLRKFAQSWDRLTRDC